MAARHSASRQPTSTRMPARRSSAMPLPSTTGFGSPQPMTTRAGRAARIAPVHGPVRPTWQHGSSVTYSVVPRAGPRSAANAFTSACGSPARR